jgi:hypothetical protein
MADVRITPWLLAGYAAHTLTGWIGTCEPFKADLEAKVSDRVLEDSGDGGRVHKKDY